MRYPPVSQIPGRPPVVINPIAKPGTYQVRLTVDGKSQTQSFELKINPNETYTRAQTDEKGKAWMALYEQSEKTVQAILKGLEAKKKAAEAAKANPALKDAAAEVAKVADNFEASMVSTGTTLVQIISEPTKPLAFLTSLHNLLEHTEGPPNKPWYQVFEKYSGEIDAKIAEFDKRTRRSHEAAREMSSRAIGRDNAATMKFSKLNRDVHRWGSIIILVPTAVIMCTGVMLQLKKQSAWIQPATQTGSSRELSLSFDQILAATQDVPEAEVKSWDDIDRLDVRPGKGMLKVRCKNRWEVQLDAKTGEVLQVAYRRSDLIESIHDGSFFHEHVKLWLFLPAALILGVLVGNGHLLVLPALLGQMETAQEGSLRSMRHCLKGLSIPRLPVGRAEPVFLMNRVNDDENILIHTTVVSFLSACCHGSTPQSHGRRLYCHFVDCGKRPRTRQ